MQEATLVPSSCRAWRPVRRRPTVASPGATATHSMSVLKWTAMQDAVLCVQLQGLAARASELGGGESWSNSHTRRAIGSDSGDLEFEDMFGSGGGAGSLQAVASLEVGPRRLRVCILYFVVAHSAVAAAAVAACRRRRPAV